MKNKFFLTILGLILLISVAQASVTANFSANSTYSASYPVAINFTNSSVCDPACTDWAWDFNGDGSIDSIGQNPTHIYTTSGVYSPKLIVSNDINTGTKIMYAYITVDPIYVPTVVPQPTRTWIPTYHNDSTQFSYKMDTRINLQNSTFLKYWLQNFTATGNFSVIGFATGLMAPLTQVFGFWIYGIIWGLYMFAVWIRSQDVTLPLVIGILSIGFFGLLFPKESMPVIILMLVVCGAIIITKLLKDSV